MKNLKLNKKIRNVALPVEILKLLKLKQINKLN